MFCSWTRRLETRKPAARSAARAFSTLGAASLISISWPLFAMMVDELAIDGLAAAEAFLTVPIFDGGLAQLPAEIYFPPAKARGKVHQAGLDVLNLYAHAHNRFHRLPQAFGGAVAPLTNLE